MEKYHVKLGISKVAGCGVFATTLIPKNFQFCRYCPNTLASKPPYQGEIGCSFYGLTIKDPINGWNNLYIDGLKLNGEIAHWTALINHDSKPNLEISVYGIISSKKKIKENEEIFLDYGIKYWISALPPLQAFDVATIRAYLTNKPNKKQKLLKLKVINKINTSEMWQQLKMRLEDEIQRRESLSKEEQNLKILENQNWNKKRKTDLILVK